MKVSELKEVVVCGRTEDEVFDTIFGSVGVSLDDDLTKENLIKMLDELFRLTEEHQVEWESFMSDVVTSIVKLVLENGVLWKLDYKRFV